MTMELGFRAWPFLVAVAASVAPPAMIPPPVQPAALSSNAVVSQMLEANVGMAAAPAAIPASNAQVAPRLRGQPVIVPAQSGLQPTESDLIQALQSTPTGADGNHQEVRSYTPTASMNGWTGSVGAIVLAAVTGAMAGGLWQRRAEHVKSKESITEMTAASSTPKFAVAALAGEEPFDPIGLRGAPSRRDLFGSVAAASLLAVAAPQPAQADFMGEPARAFKKYGGAVLKLEDSVQRGDLDAIRPKLRKFDLLTGAYRNEPQKLDRVSEMTGKIIDAVEAGDKATVKKEYANLLEYTNMKNLLREIPPPKGARVVDTSSSIAGTAKLTTLMDR